MFRITSSIRIALAAVVVSAGLQEMARCQDADPRREPAGAITEAIRLLEGGDHVAFVKQCMRPAEVEEMVAKFGTIEEVAKEFAKTDRPRKLLEILRAAAALKPVLNAQGTRADFRFEKPVAGASRLSLAKVGELWFLRD